MDHLPKQTPEKQEAPGKSRVARVVAFLKSVGEKDRKRLEQGHNFQVGLAEIKELQEKHDKSKTQFGRIASSFNQLVEARKAKQAEHNVGHATDRIDDKGKVYRTDWVELSSLGSKQASSSVLAIGEYQVPSLRVSTSITDVIVKRQAEYDPYTDMATEEFVIDLVTVRNNPATIIEGADSFTDKFTVTEDSEGWVSYGVESTLDKYSGEQNNRRIDDLSRLEVIEYLADILESMAHETEFTRSASATMATNQTNHAN